ncbi:hypothetical protein KKI17_00595 [Patescibacteria group bacterium]|nr:hypothetical protein [Patescibacteria group bacterium]
MPKRNILDIVRGAGLAAGIWTILGKAVQERGGTDEDFHRLARPEGEDLIGKIADFIVGAGKGVESAHIIDLDVDPFVPNGWTIEEHIKGGQLEWDPTKLSFYLSEGQQHGGHVQGDKLREELKGKLAYNANLLDDFLAHPELIPEDLKGKRVFFWGTIYRHPSGPLRVRYLHWHGGGWGWYFAWLGSDLYDNYLAAVPASI